MTTPISSTPLTNPPNPIPSTPSVPVPQGIGAQPTTYSSAASAECCFSGIARFFTSLLLSLISCIKSSCDCVSRWLGAGPPPLTESTTPWQLPEEPSPITVIPVETLPIPVSTTGSVAPVTSPIVEPDAFAALPLTDLDRQKMYELFHTLGAVNTAMLAFHALHLNRLGDEIDHVHPFKLLEYLCKHSVLVRDIDSMHSNFIKWGRLIGGVREKMGREDSHIPACKSGFARSMNVNLDELDSFITRDDFDGMVAFLIDVKMGRRVSVWVEPTPPPITRIEPPPEPIVESPPVTTEESPPVTAIESPPVTTTVVEITPPPRIQVSNLPFDSGDEEILTELMTRYQESTRMGLVYEHNSLQLLWSHLGARHCLKILAHLHSKPVLMNQLDTICQLYGTNALFLRALSGQLARTPFIEVRPYIEDFANTCQLDPIQVKRLVKNGQWSQLVEEIRRSYKARDLI